MSTSGSKFSRMHESLPGESQETLLKKHPFPLLDICPEEKGKKLTTAAVRAQHRTKRLPQLDLSSKRRELSRLLDELERDAKRSFVKERSNLQEILQEIVDSLTNWINAIWSAVFEYRIHFSHAHDCLMFIANVLDRVDKSRGCCKCSYQNLYVPVFIMDKDRTMVKTFHLNGAQTLDRVLLWIWREMFLTLLAYGSDREEEKIPSMLQDIKDALGWQSLERMIMGGKSSIDPHEDEDDSDVDEDGEDFEDDNDHVSHTCPLHAVHWPPTIRNQAIHLQNLVKDMLNAMFKAEPTLDLYNSILTLSNEPEATENVLVKDLSEIATAGSESYTAALQIHSLRDCASALDSLLESHSYLLRSRDAPALQAAAICISHNPLFHSKAISILERELIDTARSIKAAVIPCFSTIDDRKNREAVLALCKLPVGSDSRADRLMEWIDGVITPIQAPHPVAFAAFMMGLPVGPEEADSDDPLGIMDFDNDPDLQDLRDELRPRFKQRFEGWTNAAVIMKGANVVLLKVYEQIIEMMPYLMGTDVVEEMIGKLADRPSKIHICDALDALLAFSKVQKRRLLKKRKPQAKLTGRGFTFNVPQDDDCEIVPLVFSGIVFE